MYANANASLRPLLASYGRRAGSSGGSESSGGSGERSSCSSSGSGAGRGRLALVCLHFSDPPVRRQALVRGSELVEQLAEALAHGGGSGLGLKMGGGFRPRVPMCGTSYQPQTYTKWRLRYRSVRTTVART
jgi:hypothetical protein